MNGLGLRYGLAMLFHRCLYVSIEKITEKSGVDDMKKLKIILFYLGIALLIFASGCGETENEVSIPTKTPAIEDGEIIEQPEPINAREVYSKAFSELYEAEALTFDIEMSHKIKVSGQLFEEDVSSVFSISYSDEGYEYYSADTLRCGSKSALIEEYYSGNFVSLVVDGEHKFYSICADTDERCFPVVLIDPSLYSTVEAVEEEGIIKLSFSSPTTAEEWVLPADAAFIDAQGQVLVDADGSVAEMRYTIRYTDLVSEHEYEFVSRPREEVMAFSVPEIDSDFVFLDFADAPYYSIRAEGMALQSSELSFTNSLTVGLGAASMHDLTVSDVDISGSGESFTFIHDFEGLADFEMGKETVKREDLQSYKNGIYRDSSTEKKGIELDSKVVQAHAVKIFRGPSVPLEFWAAANAEDLGGVLLIKFRLSERFAEEALAYISTQYYEDPEYFAELSSSINSRDSYAYITIDMSNGLPLSRGFYQLGTHELTDTASYISEQYFELEINQSVDCCSEQAYYDINKEYRASGDESNVNPLLYRVSGQNGEKMWLLCGMADGSEYDVYPQELYGVIDECDNIMLHMPVNKEEKSRYKDDIDFYSDIVTVQSYESETLKERIGEELFEKVSNYKLVHAHGVHDNTNLKAITTYDVISNPRQLANLDAYYSTGDLMVDYAKRNGISVISSADTLEILKIRNSVSDETAVECINDFLNEGLASRAASLLEYHGIWKSGDEELLYELSKATYSPDDPAERELAEELKMYDEILSEAAFRQLRSGDCTFLVAQPYMLYNDASGLIKTLTEAGCSVERVTVGYIKSAG